MSAQRATPLHSFNDIMVLVPGARGTGYSTPLIGATAIEDALGASVLVQLNVLQTYERIIFELQQQVLRYKLMLDQMLLRSAASEEQIDIPPTQLDPASVRVVRSVARIPASSVLRAWEDEDR